MSDQRIRNDGIRRGSEASPKNQAALDAKALGPNPPKIEVISTPVPAKSAYTMAVEEQMDIDATEAIALAANGQTRRRGSSSSAQDDDPKIDEVRAKPKLQLRHNPSNDSTEKPETKANAAEKTSNIEFSTQKPQDIKASHKQLMAVTQTMSRKDLGTFMAQKGVERLEGIFSGKMWVASKNAKDELTGLQVAQAAPAA